MSDELQTSIPGQQLYPEGTVFMARTNLFETRMLGYTNLNLDTATALLAGLVNGLSTIRHEAAFSPEALPLFQRAGIKVDEDVHLYRTQQEAETLADSFIAQGKRLFWFYPPPAGRYSDSSHLISPGLYRYLNSKANLEELVPQQHLPRRKILSHEEFASYTPDTKVFLKSSGDVATGWGYAVHFCHNQDSLSKAKLWFAKHHDSVPSIIVEEAVPLVACWCAGIVIDDTDSTCFGGAEQLFASPGRQSGTMIDPEVPFPAAGATLAKQVGETARQLGFRGVGGIDIGLSYEGKLVVFDPNFRLASSTTQLLFHTSAAKRSGLPVSRSFQARPAIRFKDLVARLEAPVGEGWFVPTRFFNGELHPHSEGKHIVTGFVLGRSRDEAEATAVRFQGYLEVLT